MANTSPRFTSTPVVGAVSVSTANTNRDGTGTIADVTATAPTDGTRIWEVVYKATGQPADSVMTLFLHDGTNYHLFDELDLGAPAAASTTVVGYRTAVTYANLVLPSGWKLCAAITVALTSGVVKVIALGGVYT